MAYTRVTTKIEYSDNSDYSSPETDTTLTQTSSSHAWCEVHMRLKVGTGSLTLDLANLPADVDECIIQNHSSTAAEIVRVDFANTINGGVESLYVEAGTIRSIGEVLKANDLVLDSLSGTVQVTVILLGPAS
jgi:hypothetical protein